MKTVLALGHNGFTGRAFRQFAIRSGMAHSFRFVGLDLSVDATCNTFAQHSGDASDPKFLDHILLTENPAYVVNLAGMLSGSRDQMLSANVSITDNLLSAITRLHLPVDKVLLIGSAAEYGIPTQLPVPETAPLHPVTLYGLTKVFQTELAQWHFRTHAIPVVVARTFNIIGPGVPAHLSIGSFFRQIAVAKNDDEITVGNLDTRRDFLPIDEILEAYWLLLTNGVPGMVYNVCCGRSVRLYDIVAMMIAQSGKQLTLRCEPDRLRAFDIPDIFGDNKLLTSLTGWKPKCGIRETIEQMFR